MRQTDDDVSSISFSVGAFSDHGIQNRSVVVFIVHHTAAEYDCSLLTALWCASFN